MKRIVFTTMTLDPERGGGTAERTRQLCIASARNGACCTVIALAGTSWLKEFEQAGVDVWLTGSVGKRFPLPCIDPFRLYRILMRADAVHALGYWNLLSVAVCFAARLARVPYFLSPAGEFAALDEPRPVMRIFHALFGRGMIRRAQAIVAITPREADETCTRLGLPRDRLLVLPNGVCRADRKEGTIPGPIAAGEFILFMGRLAPIKGPDLLIQAFARICRRHSAFDLVIAGPDFGMAADLRDLVQELDLGGRVHFTGHMDEAARTAAYRSASLLAVPSRSEAMSLVALEAAAEATPVLLTISCGFDDVQKVGGGLAVPPTVDGLADGLERLLAQPADLPAMGLRLQAHVRRTYGWDTIARRLTDAFGRSESDLPPSRRSLLGFGPPDRL